MNSFDDLVTASEVKDRRVKPAGATYFIQRGEAGPIKIGYTRRHPEVRKYDLQTASPEPLRLLGSIEGNWERALHSTFRKSNVGGEWFSPDRDVVDVAIHSRNLRHVSVALSPWLSRTDHIKRWFLWTFGGFTGRIRGAYSFQSNCDFTEDAFPELDLMGLLNCRVFPNLTACLRTIERGVNRVNSLPGCRAVQAKMIGGDNNPPSSVCIDLNIDLDKLLPNPLNCGINMFLRSVSLSMSNEYGGHLSNLSVGVNLRCSSGCTESPFGVYVAIDGAMCD